MFTLLDCKGPPITAETRHLDDTLDPVWPDVLELVVPPSVAAKTREPRVRVTVIDRDFAPVDVPKPAAAPGGAAASAPSAPADDEQDDPW